MDDMLRDVASIGTGARAKRTLKRSDLGGKTGTTNDAVDVWFSGYTPTLSTTVWMGFDQPRSLGSNAFGSGLALSTWLDYTKPVLQDVPEQPQRPLPGGLIVHHGEYYFSEFPPGQAVAALDLSTGDELTDFLNNMRPADNAPTQVRPLNPAPPAGPSPGPASIPVPAQRPPAVRPLSPAPPPAPSPGPPSIPGRAPPPAYPRRVGQADAPAMPAAAPPRSGPAPLVTIPVPSATGPASARPIQSPGSVELRPL